MQKKDPAKQEKIFWKKKKKKTTRNDSFVDS